MTEFNWDRLLQDLPTSNYAFLLAALAVTATGLVGELAFRALKVPRITGYFLVGVVYGSWGLLAPPATLAGDLRLIVDLALSVLLFELGTRVNLRWLRANPWLLATSLAEAVVTFAVSLLTLRAFGSAWASAIGASVVLVSTSPAIVMRVVSEFRADGQVSNRLMLLTALNTIYAVLGAKAVESWLDHEQGGALVAALGASLYVVVGSALLGVLLALAIRALTQRFDLRDDSAVLVLLGMLAIALALVGLGGLSTLLVPLIAGMSLKMLTARPLLFPRHFGTAGGVLVALLFLITGMTVQLPALAVGGVTAVALIAARVLAKIVVVGALSWPGGLHWRQGIALGLALAPTSGVALILATELAGVSPEFSTAAGATLFSAIAILELAGPLLVQWSLRSSGETDANL